MMWNSDISLIAQRIDSWIEVAIVVGIVAISALSSAGRWIVKQIELNRQKEAMKRDGMRLDDPRGSAHPAGVPPTLGRAQERTTGFPPVAAPIPPVAPRPSRKETPATPPVMERVLEVLLERTAGTPLERRIREAVQQKTAPPPPPARKAPQDRSVQRPPARKLQQRTNTGEMTIAERAAIRDRARQTAVEQEEQQMIRREQKFTDDTDQRLGRVETHIKGTEVRDSATADPYELNSMLESPDSVRRAILLSEILGPPVSLRESTSF